MPDIHLKGGIRQVLELWIIRHGETDWNLTGRIQGWTDVPLNPNGILQAERLALYLEGIPFQAILSSDLQRAAATANRLGTRIKAPQFTYPSLRERGFGRGEGLFREEMDRKFPTGVPDAEPDGSVVARIQDFLTKMSETFPKGRILCVSHGATIRMLLREISPVEIPPLHNTGVSRIRWNGENWHLIGVNWAEHLQHGNSAGLLTDPVALGFRSTQDEHARKRN